MEKLLEQLRERYVLNENQERLFRPGLKTVAMNGVTSIDHPACRAIIDYCESKWNGEPVCPKRA